MLSKPFLVVLLALVMPQASLAKEPLLLYYENYPPFAWEENGQVKGKFVDRAKEILAHANLPAEWRKSSYKRMMRDLEANSRPFCIAGYAFSEARSKFAQYTEAFAEYPPSGIAIHSSATNKFAGFNHILDILTDNSLRGGFIEGASYGSAFDDALSKSNARHLFISGEDEDLLVLLANNRVDYAMVNEDQIAFYRSRMPGVEELISLYPGGMEPASPVYFLCSLSVEEALVTRLSKAIEELSNDH